MHSARLLLGFLVAMSVGASSLEVSAREPSPMAIGVARIDITPDYPIRLTGYAARSGMSTGAVQRLWAKALALGSDRQGPRLLITVDNCGVSARVIDEVARRLKANGRIRKRRGFAAGRCGVAQGTETGAGTAPPLRTNMTMPRLRADSARSHCPGVDVPWHSFFRSS